MAVFIDDIAIVCVYGKQQNVQVVYSGEQTPTPNPKPRNAQQHKQKKVIFGLFDNAAGLPKVSDGFPAVGRKQIEVPQIKQR